MNPRITPRIAAEIFFVIRPRLVAQIVATSWRAEKMTLGRLPSGGDLRLESSGEFFRSAPQSAGRLTIGEPESNQRSFSLEG